MKYYYFVLIIKMSKLNYKKIAQVTLNVTLISSLIAILFFTYGKNLEKSIVENQSEYIAESIATDIKIFFPEETRKIILDSLVVPDMQQADKDVEDRDDALKNKAILIFVPLCVVGIFTTFLICQYGKVEKKHIFAEGIIILLFVFCAEILFLNIIIRNYKTADPNFVKMQILKAVKTEFSS
jgi:hypothetical protein